MSTFSQHDFENSSAELLRKIAALSAEEIDRAYETLHAPDARGAVRELANTALLSCAARAKDAPYQLHAAYEWTEVDIVPPRVAAASSHLAHGRGRKAAPVTAVRMPAPALPMATEAEIESTSAAMHHVCVEFVRQAEMFEINPAPIPHVHHPHEVMASTYKKAGWLFTVGGMFVAFLLTATAFERPVIAAVAATTLFVMLEFGVSVAMGAVMPGRKLIEPGRTFLLPCVGVLLLGVLSVLLGRFADGEWTARFVEYNPLVWYAIEIALLFLGAYAFLGHRRFSWSSATVRQLRALEKRLVELRWRFECLRQQPEPGPVISFGLGHAGKGYAGTSGVIPESEIPQTHEYRKQEIMERDRPSGSTGAIRVFRRSCARMHRQIAAGHTTAALKFTRSMADQIQTLVSCGAGWSWGMALFTLVSISLTIVVGWGVLTQGLMMIGDEPGLADLLVLSSRAISPGFDIGVNSSANRTDWLSNGPGGVWSMRYPGNQAWGAVFLTVGSAHTTPRPGIDLSSYQSLVLEMRGDSEGTIEVGIKDSTQPDDGKGVRLPLQISAEWRTYEIPLTSFAGADLRKIHVLTEWIFNGPQAKTIEVRSVRFTKSTGNPPSDGRRSRLGASYHLAS